MIIDGRKIADEMLEELKSKIAESGKHFKLAAILIGESPVYPHTHVVSVGASKKFLELKQKSAEKIGIKYEIHELPVTDSEQLSKQIVEIAVDQSNLGVIVELPLPAELDVQRILNAVPQEKDVDVLSQKSQKAFLTGDSKVLPPAVEAVRIIFEKYNIDIRDKKCAVFGQGLLVGQPVSHWLTRQGAEVTAIDEFTQNPEQFSRQADIIISGVGKHNLVTSDMVKSGAVVIDFGYENIEGRSVGDVDFEPVSRIASLITPVPGGVGPIVIAAVLKNLITLSLNSH